MVNDRQGLDLTPLPRPAVVGPADWRISLAPVRYPDAVAAMEACVAEIATHHAGELVWLLEHPPLYTSGTSGKAQDLHEPRRSRPSDANGRVRCCAPADVPGCIRPRPGTTASGDCLRRLAETRRELHAVCPGSLCLGVFFSRCGVIFAGSGAPGTPRGP